jgi:hypothetical protein
MAIIIATVTEDARKYYPQFFGGLLGISDTTNPATPVWNPVLTHFRVGVGGYVGTVPRTPDATLRKVAVAPNDTQDLDILVDPTRLPLDQRYPVIGIPSFEKAFNPGDLTYSATNTVQARCELDFGDFNSDGTSSPEIWEIGLFSDHPEFTRASGTRLMVAYGTFPKTIKDATKQVLLYVRVTF